jgi:hypothetical protein
VSDGDCGTGFRYDSTAAAVRCAGAVCDVGSDPDKAACCAACNTSPSVSSCEQCTAAECLLGTCAAGFHSFSSGACTPCSTGTFRTYDADSCEPWTPCPESLKVILAGTTARDQACGSRLDVTVDIQGACTNTVELLRQMELLAGSSGARAVLTSFRQVLTSTMEISGVHNSFEVDANRWQLRRGIARTYDVDVLAVSDITIISDRRLLLSEHRHSSRFLQAAILVQYDVATDNPSVAERIGNTVSDSFFAQNLVEAVNSVGGSLDAMDTGQILVQSVETHTSIEVAVVVESVVVDDVAAVEVKLRDETQLAAAISAIPEMSIAPSDILSQVNWVCYAFAEDASVQTGSCKSCVDQSAVGCTAASCSTGFHSYADGICQACTEQVGCAVHAPVCLSGAGEDITKLHCESTEYPYYLAGGTATYPDDSAETLIVIVSGVSIIGIMIVGFYLNCQSFNEPTPHIPDTNPSGFSKAKRFISDYGGAVLAVLDLVTDWLATFKDMATDINASSDLFPAAVVTIAASFLIGLCGTLYYVFVAKDTSGEPLLDRKSTEPGSFRHGTSKYMWVVLLSATSPETLVLMPWKHRASAPDAVLTAGGLPNMHVAVFCTVAAAAENIPQMVIQIIYLMRVAERTTMVVPWNLYASVGFSIISLLHRVLGRYATACLDVDRKGRTVQDLRKHGSQATTAKPDHDERNASDKRARSAAAERALAACVASETGGTDVMTTYLTSMGIPAPHATNYASKLDEEGYDTVAIFDTLSIDALVRDFAFKKGHAAAVENFRARTQPRP